MTKIKICGLFRAEDVEFVNEAGPDYAGFVIGFPKSHRNVEPDRARALREGLRAGIRPVGVFVDAPVETVAALLKGKTIEVAQLHGGEDEDYMRRLRLLVPGCEIWKAFKVRSSQDLRAARDCSADKVLLDNGQGTGARFDWSLLKGFARPYLLAGGLTPENLPEAVRSLHPLGVDISGGVETDGHKDRQKILAAVRAVRGKEG